ncbi:MAG TPA: acetyl-CoA carboxylase biotin carboxylase subunit [Chloroflexota bacterium]
MFRKVLVANRGEIAVRIIRACRELGIKTVLAHSEVDRHSLPAFLADETVCIGPPAADRSYLNIPNIVSAALITGADALHPGYGFLAENPYLAEACQQCGITFIGPTPEAIERFSDKLAARQFMRRAGLPVLPGSEDAFHHVEEALDVAAELGYPLMIKAAAGGGGRGMRIVRDADELRRLFPVAHAEAQKSFGDGRLYLERLVEAARHIEIQVVADRYGHVIHLGERDCSLQRRHQKLLEEAPSPAVSLQLREAIGAMAVRGAAEAGYESVGTVEFLLDQDERFYFIEMNTRIQVEHPVTEMVTGEDLVKWQIRLAAGERLTLRQEDIALVGHAIECRVTAEDPERDFAPAAGPVEGYLPPGGPGVRVDSHLYPGYEVPPYYDSLLAKIITWGKDRAEAITRMERALRECRIEGVVTNIPYHLRVLASPEFRAGGVYTSSRFAVTGPAGE